MAKTKNVWDAQRIWSAFFSSVLNNHVEPKALSSPLQPSSLPITMGFTGFEPRGQATFRRLASKLVQPDHVTAWFTSPIAAEDDDRKDGNDRRRRHVLSHGSMAAILDLQLE